MDEKRRTSAVAAIVVAIALLCAGYVGGYFLLSSTFTIVPDNKVRSFRYEWQARLYSPAAKVESCLIGQRVVPAWPSP
jgi:hypothetical protein